MAAKIVLHSFISFVFCLTSVFGQTSVCGSGWFEAGGSCYIFVPMPQSYMDALKLCATSSFNASLVQLETLGEKTHLVAHLMTTYEKIFVAQKFWVAATGADSVWVWKSGVPLTYVDFMEGIKTTPGCLAFGIPTLQKYKGYPCTDKNLVICERNAPSSSTSGTRATAAPTVNPVG